MYFLNGPKGKLRDKVIDDWKTSGNLKGIQDNALAVMGNIASSEKICWHDKCFKGSENWCKYQADKINGKKFYKPGEVLDMTIIKYIKPIFVDLCKDELVKKCLDCKTQN